MYRDGAPAGPPAAGRVWGALGKGARRRGFGRVRAHCRRPPGPPTPRGVGVALRDGTGPPPGGTAPDLRRGGVRPRGCGGDPSLGTCHPWGQGQPRIGGFDEFFLLMRRRKRKKSPSPAPELRGCRQQPGDKGATVGSAAMVPHAAAGPPRGGSRTPEASGGARRGAEQKAAEEENLLRGQRRAGTLLPPRRDQPCRGRGLQPRLRPNALGAIPAAGRARPAGSQLPVVLPVPASHPRRSPCRPAISSAPGAGHPQRSTCRPAIAGAPRADHPWCRPRLRPVCFAARGAAPGSHGDGGDIRGTSGGDGVTPPGAQRGLVSIRAPPSPRPHGGGAAGGARRSRHRDVLLPERRPGWEGVCDNGAIGTVAGIRLSLASRRCPRLCPWPGEGRVPQPPRRGARREGAEPGPVWVSLTRGSPD